MFRGFTDHANGFIMAVVSDVDNLVPFFDETQHFTVHFAHQRACSINDMHAPS